MIEFQRELREEILANWAEERWEATYGVGYG